MRRPWILATLAAITVVAAGAGGIWYWVYQSSPEYAIRALGGALRSHNSLAVERYVDFDQLAASLMKDVPTARELQPGGSISSSAMRRALIGGSTGVLAPLLGGGLRQLVTTAVKDTVDTPTSSALVVTQEVFGDGVDWRYISILGIDRVHREGDLAIVALKVADTSIDETTTLNARMARENGNWRLVGFENGQEWFQALSEDRVAFLDSVNSGIGASVYARYPLGVWKPFKITLTVDGTSVARSDAKQHSDSGWIGHLIAGKAVVTNQGSTPLYAVIEGVDTVNAPYHTDAIQLSLRTRNGHPIPPGVSDTVFGFACDDETRAEDRRFADNPHAYVLWFYGAIAGADSAIPYSTIDDLIHHRHRTPASLDPLDSLLAHKCR